VEFDGLPALSSGYIVDGSETNDPLTNLNSGLSTNFVLGLSSITEVTVDTLSYSVDQARHGASQIDYVTKSGTNQVHGNLYELWNGSLLNVADYFTNAKPGNHQPRATINHFGGNVGGAIARTTNGSSSLTASGFGSHCPLSRRRRSKHTSCSTFLGVKRPAAGPAGRIRIVCSINKCPPSMEIPAAHPPRYLAGRLAPLRMVAPTGTACRTPVTTKNRYRPSASCP
jgi:hypothetical protein